MIGSPAEEDASVARLRERWVAFAFTGADLVVEASADGVIRFAAGAFRQRFGAEPENFVGQRAIGLIAPPDQAAFGVTLRMAALHGRTSPVVLRLSDAARTPCAVATMLVPAPRKRLCLTFGPVPSVLSPEPDAARPGGAGMFGREAEEWLRGGASGSLGLVEVRGWSTATEAMSPPEAEGLRARIGHALAATRPGALAGELAEGRFGVLSAGPLDGAALARDVAALLPGSPEGDVTGLGMALGTHGLTPSQAVRAVRFALGRFTREGTEAVLAESRGQGLAGVIAHAQSRARGLRTAIRERQFSLDFQPVVRLADRVVAHHEALLRPGRSGGAPALNPQEFVTFAEAVGLAEELDFAVLDLALAALHRTPGTAVAMNVSGLSMQSAAFRTRMLDRIATETWLPRPGGKPRLIVELTETAEIDDIAGAAGTIRQLRAAGVPVCIDDFGSGNAAFRYLRDFAVDFVKIDGSYVQAALNSAQERLFIGSMAQLARSVGARVVAEMIETDAQAKLMAELQVEYGQGWLFGRPGKLAAGADPVRPARPSRA
jgi:EAL domain-containing protein (putative c-di-GMP-specific phosphodiesterase class I)